MHLSAIRTMQRGSGHTQLCSLIVGCFSICTTWYISVQVDQHVKFLVSWHSISWRHTIRTVPPYEKLCPHLNKISYATLSVYR